MTDKREALSELAAQKLVEQIRKKPNSNLGLPTGRTPVTMYRHIVRLSREFGLDWSEVHCFALDDYLETLEEYSFQKYLEKNLYQHIGISAANTHNPRFNDDYDQLIEKHGGLDLTVLGIGANGHIAFNEPGTPEASYTQCIWLDESSRNSLKGGFPEDSDVPTKAVTMGISTILSSKSIIMLAFGEEKKEILKRAFDNGVDPTIPASFLVLHKNVSILTDCD
ncbi:MAG: glucosamine-6-phosphate deaminase [Candidatus Obscuribacterales bacterium]|nr:glucosamine-6-phosphate deaminase [Candidatus Obscuribacterales bacterium]